jgi:hypothetical protein
LRQWLKHYGIGVDCSAFVQQALSRVIQACRAATGEYRGGLDSDGAGWMTSKGVYREVTSHRGELERFQQVSTPGEARPGDVLVKQGHMRMVARTERVEGAGIILQLAESTSATDIPSGQAGQEPDIGPRLIQVEYPQPNRPIHQQMPSRKRLYDDGYHPEPEERKYILGRLRALDHLCRAHPELDVATASKKDIDAKQGSS